MLARGAQGSEVDALRRQLRALRWRQLGPVGSAWGLPLDAAVRQQQRSMGLVPDGIVGPATEAALATAVRPSQPQPPPVSVLMDTPYRSQRDNVHSPSSTCNVTSYAMALSICGVKAADPNKQLEDELYERIVSPEGTAYFQKNFAWAVGKNAPWTVHGMLVWVASTYGISTTFSTTWSWKLLTARIAARSPVVLSGRFTASGHIVCVQGLGTTVNDLVVHDPWGDWNRGYRDVDGSSRVYTWEALSSIVGADGAIWAHTFPKAV